jgi:hypothetical protein
MTGPNAALMQLMGGVWLSRAIAVSARLGIPDLLKQSPRSASALAQELEADPDILDRLMQLLAACKIFEVNDEGCFENTAISSLLCSSHENSLRHFCMLAGEEYTTAWGELLHSVKTGESAFPKAFGASIYQYMDDHPEAGRVYDLAMGDLARPIGRLLASFPAFAAANLVVDVGGGNGSILRPILAAHPHIHGISADRGEVCERAQSQLEVQGATELGERLSFVATDFFESVPRGDIHILKNVLFNWKDERCVAILKCIAKAMDPEQGQLMIVEPLLDPVPTPRQRMEALLKAVICDGGTRSRSEPDLKNLLHEAGLYVQETQQLPTGHSVLFCRRHP